MAYSQEIYENAKIRLDARRQQAIRENEERRKAFVAMNPEYGQLDRKIAQTSIQLTRVMLSGQKDITETVAEIRDNNLAMQERQREILAAAMRGLTNEDIARQFDITSSGVKQCLSKIYMKLNVANRSEAIAYALQKKIV